MNGNLYGTASSASLNPKLFMVQALKKILLNNGNILKIYNGSESDEIKERMIRLRLANSEALIEEMKKHLNIEGENKAVEGVIVSFDWLLKEFAEIEEYIKGRKEKLEEGMEAKIKGSEYIIKNLKEGFEGMKDDSADEEKRGTEDLE